MGLLTGTCVFGFVHLVYKAPWDLLDLCTHLVVLLWLQGPGAVQSHTVGVQICCLYQSASHGLVNWHVCFRSHTPCVQSATVPPRFVYTASGTCMGPRSRKCTEPYIACTKMPFASECFPWVCDLACMLLESCSKCTRCYGTSHICVHSYLHLYEAKVSGIYRAVQRVYEDAICARVLPMGL